MFDLAQQISLALDRHFLAAALVFMRIGAACFLLPGLGESFLSMRVRLGAAVALTMLAAPLIDTRPLPVEIGTLDFARLALVEAAVGLIVGMSTRMLVFALQYAGAIAAQSTALAQMAGPGLTPDPMPAIGNTLLLAGLTLAMVLDLHVKAVFALAGSYQVLGFGATLAAADVSWLGLALGKAAFDMAFSLATPFILAAFLYNVSLGLINRAMPQLMVAFVGAPAITGITLVLLLLSAPVSLAVWHQALDARLSEPLALP